MTVIMCLGLARNGCYYVLFVPSMVLLELTAEHVCMESVSFQNASVHCGQMLTFSLFFQSEWVTLSVKCKKKLEYPFC